jgi:hypothetical protein
MRACPVETRLSLVFSGNASAKRFPRSPEGSRQDKKLLIQQNVSFLVIFKLMSKHAPWKLPIRELGRFFFLFNIRAVEFFPSFCIQARFPLNIRLPRINAEGENRLHSIKYSQLRTRHSSVHGLSSHRGSRGSVVTPRTRRPTRKARNHEMYDGASSIPAATSSHCSFVNFSFVSAHVS